MGRKSDNEKVLECFRSNTRIFNNCIICFSLYRCSVWIWFTCRSNVLFTVSQKLCRISRRCNCGNGIRFRKKTVCFHLHLNFGSCCYLYVFPRSRRYDCRLAKYNYLKNKHPDLLQFGCFFYRFDIAEGLFYVIGL